MHEFLTTFFDVSIVRESIGLYLGGLVVTIQLVALSLIIGLISAIPLSVVASSPSRLYTIPIRVFVTYMRGTPLLVQIFLVYYGLGQSAFIKSTILWSFFKHAWFCALFSFSLNTTGYTIEIFRGAIEATAKGEIEAALSLGMSKWQLYRRIILPSAFRRALPAYSNEVIFMLHASSLASVITLVDITGAARIVNSIYYSPFEAFLTAAAFYGVLTFSLIMVFKRVESKWYAHVQPNHQR
ncbi:MAG: ABC transporter permease [Chitinivibrionales bacterium]|nr:ABC transporter permease [Chitinivibrionales bacterium]